MATDAMRYEDIALSKPSKGSLKKELKRARETDINKMGSLSILGVLVKRHKFGLLMTFTIVYVTFSLFGTVIVGLVESL